MRRRCLCKCHEGSHGDRMRADGVDLCDSVEAVVACRVCRGHHDEAIATLPRADVSRPKAYPPTENGEFPYLPPSGWNGEEGG